MIDDRCPERVLAVVTGIAGPARTPPEATPDTPLGEEGFWLDSIAMLEVMLACEQEFDVVFDWESEVTPDMLRTARTLADAVQRKAS
jgi:acyl carrier protein